MTPTLVMTKYAPPPAFRRLVARERLIANLMSGLSRRLTLITAPAGFGKSTLAAEFSRRAGRQVAWLSLDRYDNDPARWGAYLAAAIRRAGVPATVDTESPATFGEPPRLETLLANIINASAVAGSPLMLVLDDYHLIHAGEIHDAVGLMLDLLPPNLHVVISTRTRPPLALARLKARGDMTEITAADLRLTPDEAAAFLRTVMGLDLPAEGMAALMARTEGWAAGLQLAALSIRADDDWMSSIGHFGSSNPDLLRYLADEVISQQPDDVRTFLLRTAILDRLTGPLCDALTGRADGQRTLRALEQANLFLFPLDSDRRWYRYHPLFAEFLLANLREEVGEAEIVSLRRRAAEWYRAEDELAEGIEQLLAAAAFEQAADWIEDGFPNWSLRGSHPLQPRWLDQLPESLILQRPRLAVMAAWQLIVSGEVQREPRFAQAAEYLNLAEQALAHADPTREEVRASVGVLAAIRTALASWTPLHQCPMCVMQGLAHAAECAQKAREYLPESSMFWRSIVSNSLGTILLRAGHVSAAAQAFAEAARLGARSGNLSASVAGLHRHAQLLVALGRMSAADEAYLEALRLAAENGGESLPILAPIYRGMGCLRYEWNDLEGATHLLEEALKRYNASGEVAQEAILTLARVRQSRGDATSARRLIEQAGDLLATRTRLRAAAAAWPDGVRVLLAQGDLAAAQRWIRAGGVALDREPDLWRAAEYFALARLLVAEGRAEAVLPLLRTLREVAAASGCRGTEAEARVIEALALHTSGNAQSARDSVERALALTWGEGFVRLFADGGEPIIALLRQIGRRLRRARQVDAAYVAYVERLLAILDGNSGVQFPMLSEAETAPELLERLTEREREIVQFVASGFSNKDIAQELVTEVSTVKWHLLNIYGKLQVRSRTQAVARARTLGLV